MLRNAGGVKWGHGGVDGIKGVWRTSGKTIYPVCRRVLEMYETDKSPHESDTTAIQGLEL